MVDPNKRVCAYFLDGLWSSALMVPVNFLLPWGFWGNLAVFAVALFRDAFTPQGSPGKYWLGLKIEGMGSGWGARLQTSALRNSVIQIFLLPGLWPKAIPQVWQFITTALFLVVLAVEYSRIRKGDGRRYGDVLAGERVVDLHPEQRGAKYFWLSLLFVASNVILQLLAAHFLYSHLAKT